MWLMMDKVDGWGDHLSGARGTMVVKMCGRSCGCSDWV